MTQDVRGQPVVVELAECRCPGTPHHHDTVTLRGEPSVAMGSAAWGVYGVGGTLWDVQARLAQVWLNYGIEAWTFVDERGAPEPIAPSVIERLLPFNHGGMEVAERADELYSDPVLSPLVLRRSTSSPPTPTAASTPPSPATGPSRPARSRRSSPAASAAGSGSEAPAP